MDKKALIRNFVIEELSSDHGQTNLKDDHSLLETGIIDSMGIMKLLTFIEEQFNTKISDSDLMPENFESIESIYNLLQITKTL